MALLFSCSAATPQASAASTATDDGTRAITRLLQRSADYWNRGDLDDFMKSYANAPSTLYVSSKSIVRGYVAIRAHYAKAYRGSHVGTLSITGAEVRELGHDYAVVVARWHLTLRDGTRPSGIFSLVLQRGDSGWHIIADHSP